MIYAGRNHMAGSPGCISGEKAGCTQRPQIFESEESYQKNRETLKQSLNGTWRFRYSENTKKRPVLFYEESYDSSGFDEIQVP
ncbi:MAG: hypothetical protein ACLRMN_11695 [Mediterraneibacter gnavus]